ncbi:peptidase S1 and S6, chymotrypsin/Hap [Amycolatopsis azurea DSM 43854]|uniref:Peptidase S1 and S6, chymotrypsin/Hap n=2 Tax=Amycolatopsis azurea DSM 43854 TaxID=1238180 RepID=M2Q054_9PSEU|nr:peptidase S1 and S6, chymotrypsin/Hap [Amycolatopsis azurea DSM 43854]
MKVKSMLAFFLVAMATAVSGFASPVAAAATGDEGPITSIVGGRKATEPYPFAVYIVDGCTGSLIKPNWVITAKHCNPAVKSVRIGNNDRTKAKSVGVVEQVPHRYADVKLLRLAESVSYAPIRIPGPEAATVGTATRLLGWGQTCDLANCGPMSIHNNEFDTSVLPDTSCYKINAGHEICTDNPNDGGDCYGDSGGPQITKVDGVWNLIGSDSRGTSIHCGASPSIYVDLTSPDVRPWIEKEVGGL